ncbi:YdcF family protein, partial [Pediococcus acidilactici]|nr:YdcF family protein [Pediococcus acidilactici]
RRNFIAGIFFAGSCINLTLLATLGIASYLAGDSRIGIISLAVFLLLGIIVVPLLVGFSLIINSYVMQTREGKSLTAKLSLIFGINLLLVLGAGATILLASQYLGRLTGVLLVFIGIDVTFTFIFSCYLFYSFLYQIIPIREKVNYIITLGAGIRSETVTPLLKGRLDKALEYFWKQDGNPKFVVSGGQGPDEPVSEAYAMAKYLKSQHVPEDKIILED